MAPLSSSCHFQTPLKAYRSPLRAFPRAAVDQKLIFPFRVADNKHYGQNVTKIGNILESQWSFVGGSGLVIRRKVARHRLYRKGLNPSASWIANPQIASNVFTLGTAAVLPFYTLMVVAPKAELTKRSMQSSIPYVVLGVLYAYLLYLSWTPDTFRLMFASKYWLPELHGIAKMFSNEMTLASAWIHLLAVDLFAARSRYFFYCFVFYLYLEWFMVISFLVMEGDFECIQSVIPESTMNCLWVIHFLKSPAWLRNCLEHQQSIIQAFQSKWLLSK